MNSMKGKSAMLMTKGILDMRSDPAPRLVASILTFQHPDTKKEVTLYPIPNVASKAYLARALNADYLSEKYDKVLWEDGRLPFRVGTAASQKSIILKKLFPFFSIRPSAVNGEKFDGCVLRDPVESRMAYQGILDELDPPVDARARRGMSRIDTYPEGTRVAVPWGVYHMPYFRYSLLKNGYVQLSVEEQEVFGLRQIMGIFLFSTLFALVSTMLFVSLFFY
ncbi:hypothetical protein AGDE_00120 [Angomonas deanei]|uniref:Uncharacterized protein n=1 Tax=Angomonas deanei TaxID=59799 RepID=S9WRX5_9TRYP|nr:hypothetical protein AGDE_05234 [Angomonas deanei]EPY43801.1 hypothetical protein AGDE_00120 [Angomonas deanei]CAD2219141.1 hypothetical protein, conserved [Angomonas deanei]|eukprot:EPY38695.1 hypothetical protein AGDE_05234 [Angomonas deanei]